MHALYNMSYHVKPKEAAQHNQIGYTLQVLADLMSCAQCKPKFLCSLQKQNVTGALPWGSPQAISNMYKLQGPGCCQGAAILLTILGTAPMTSQLFGSNQNKSKRTASAQEFSCKNSRLMLQVLCQ